jgi:putative Ca2+/H+ antiporter (TMEM165/GDT1 family)
VILFEVVATSLVAANATVVVGGQRLRGLISTKWIQRSSATIFLMVAIAQAGIQILG